MIFTRYACVLVFDIQKHSNSILKIIGLDVSDNYNFLNIKYEHLIWILLLCSSLQHFANNHNLKQKFVDYKSVFFKMMSKAYDYFSNIEFWLIYIVLFLTIYFSVDNILNFIRVVIVI